MQLWQVGQQSNVSAPSRTWAPAVLEAEGSGKSSGSCTCEHQVRPLGHAYAMMFPPSRRLPAPRQIGHPMTWSGCDFMAGASDSSPSESDSDSVAED